MQINDILALPIKEQTTEYCTIRIIDELPAVVINHKIGFAAITLQGSHLLTWQPYYETQPVLWLSPKSLFKDKKPIRGGIPICWPWFCDKYKPEPFHGFARISTWQFTDYLEDNDSFQLIFTLKDSQETRAIGPHTFTLSARFTFLVDECFFELQSLGDFDNTAALHSYFTVGDINQITVSGTGKHYDDSVYGGLKQLTTHPLIIDQEIGHIFTHPEPNTVVSDKALQRTVNITHYYNSNVVVWNPWITRSQTITDLPDDAYKTMLCVETACIDQLMTSTKTDKGKLAVKIKVSKQD